MLKYNFIRIIAFISVILLFFSVSVYDPSVYAKTQIMEDGYLAQIDGESGVTIGLDLNVRSVATNVIISNTDGESITLNNLNIGNGAGGNFHVSTNIITDIGTAGGRTWLSTDGLSLPSSAEGICVTATDITVVGTATQHLGDLAIKGIFMGRDVTTVNGAAIYPTLTGTSPSYTLMSAHSSGTGIDIYSSQATYVDNLTWTINTAASSTSTFALSGIYLYGASTSIADGDPANWGATLTGNAIIGSNGTGYDYASIDVGSNGSANGTILRLSLPQHSSMRIRNIYLGGTSFRGTATDNLSMYRLNITVRNVYDHGGGLIY
jgi:hypothetical protein